MRIRHQLWSIKIAMPSGYHEGTAEIRAVAGFNAVPSSPQSFSQSLCLHQLLKIHEEVSSEFRSSILEYTDHGKSHFIARTFAQKNGLGRGIWVGRVFGRIVEPCLDMK